VIARAVRGEVQDGLVSRDRGHDRLRVLRIVARLNVGGPALHTTLLHGRLPKERYESRLVFGSPGPREGDWLALRGEGPAGLVHLPALGREIDAVSDAAAFASLWRIVRSFRPHVVHTHTAKAGALGRAAAILAGVPSIVHTFHGHVFAGGYFPPARSRLFVALERVLARHTDVVAAVSESVREELLALGIGRPEQVVVVPPGLDLEPFGRCEARRGELRAEIGLPPACPIVAIVARLAPVKGHEVFLAAAELVARAHPECRFVVVGDGERRAELEALVARRGMAGRTRFLGWRADLDRVLADADVVALSSWNEGAPIALIEALAARRAVVATRAGGVGDVVAHGETGLLVAPGDAAAMARAIDELLRDPSRRHELGRRGHDAVVAQYAASRLVADVDRLYRETAPALRARRRWRGARAARQSARRAGALAPSLGGERP
jgi:glycosyltransferase involved in cell wall biosynthesis